MIPQPFSNFSSLNAIVILVMVYLDAVRANRMRNWSDAKTAGFIQMAPLSRR